MHKSIADALGEDETDVVISHEEDETDVVISHEPVYQN